MLLKYRPMETGSTEKPMLAVTDILSRLNSASDEILLSMVLSTDGLVIAYAGEVDDADLFGAYFVELKIVSEKIVNELKFTGIEELLIRSRSGSITIWPVFDKGYLACMSTPKLDANKFQLLAWRCVKKLYEQLADG